jgi:hypothetical protein
MSVDVAKPAMAHCAKRLEDRAVEDVGPDRVRRFEAEHQHEDRRQQRAATHPRQADEDSDQEPRQRELPSQSTTPLAMSSSGHRRPKALRTIAATL